LIWSGNYLSNGWVASRPVFGVGASILALMALVGCGSSQSNEQEPTHSYRQGELAGGGYINPTPEKENGEPSHEFEPDDIERAEEAPQSVREYCEGAASEAQEVGCLSHVEPSEVP
jgi:hypothetical protein